MPNPTTLALAVLACMNATFDWPGFSIPGFPTILLGGFGALLAGIQFILDFPLYLSIPDIDLFINGFFSLAVGMPSFPSFGVSIPGLSFTLPAFSGFNIPGFDASIVIKLCSFFIAAPFLIIKGIALSLLDLNLHIPDLPEITLLLNGVGLDLGLPQFSLDIFVPCLAASILTALAVIPT